MDRDINKVKSKILDGTVQKKISADCQDRVCKMISKSWWRMLFFYLALKKLIVKAEHEGIFVDERHPSCKVCREWSETVTFLKKYDFRECPI